MLPGKKKATPEAALPLVAAPAIPQDTLTDLQTLAMLGRPKKLERVNLAARIEEIGLHHFLGVESWSEAAPCRLEVQG